jgi:hypothetical protein
MTNEKAGIGIWLTVWAILALLGYFIYSGVNGALAILLIYLVVGFCTLLSIIPFVGIFLQNGFVTNTVFPYLFKITGIYSTWLTDVIYVYYLVIGSIMCVIMSGAVIFIILAFIFGMRIKKPWK